MKHLNRRTFVKLAAAAAALPAAFTYRARAEPRPDQKFLFVVTASGGASIIDSFLPVTTSMTTAAVADVSVVYPDAAVVQPPGSSLRVVRNLGLEGPFQNAYDPSLLLSKYYEDMCVVTVENTSVNHIVAQKRAMNGAGIDGGRTILEAMAMRWGEGLLLPACNMGSSGYAQPGDRTDVPPEARAEIVSNPELFSIATHGFAGLAERPSDAAIGAARAVRERLEDTSPFGSAHASSALRGRLLSLRRDLLPRLEQEDVIHKLLLIRSADGVPLSEYGLALDAESDAQLGRILEIFPDLADDALQAQAALGFLLARHGIASAVALGPSFAPSFLPDGRIADTPIAFDFSHSDHVLTQNVMWSRVAQVIDGLVTLLRETPHGAGSMWDRSMIYVATDFGRSKERPRGSISFSSGHHLNNGNLFLSPMLRGNRAYGGVDPATLLTYGFDPATGDPMPGSVMREGHLYSLVAHAMDIEFPGRYDMSGFLR
jgi:hypothetical protein